jgi:predicted ATP-grasp superfamily ATP-dependent carboligase
MRLRAQSSKLMRVFVYEFVTAGGWRSSFEDVPPSSLLAEGQAMAEAVCEDLMGMDARPLVMRDVRQGGERDEFCEIAAAADWSLVIAPEQDGILLARCRWVMEAGGRLLSPGPAVVELASDKQRTAEHLTRHQVRVPPGVIMAGKQSRSAAMVPAVLKPVDGCGSQGVRRIDRAAELDEITLKKPHRLERFVPGLAASVAVLCGPDRFVPLPACEQRLTGDGQFTYLGGRTPLPPELAERAERLALTAAGALPEPLGYLGVDLVLGGDPHGSEDYVIEINPRLTTSYVGLRAACRENLAAAMLAVAEGRQPSLSWHAAAVEFSADGRVQRA